MKKKTSNRKVRSARRRHVVIGLLPIFIFALYVALYARDNHSLNQGTPAEIITDARLADVIIPDDQPEIMAEYTGFKVSFNPARHIPNYVVWELTGVEAEGQLPRSSRFFQDTDVYGCATPDDYRNSGFDRGHMAPAADMKWSEQAMTDSHSMTNICPQDHALNSGRWSTLEKKCRQWAQRDSALWIICGPVLTDHMPQTIGNGVSVPRRFFKVILAPYASPMRAIGFIMPNSYTDEQLEQLACSVDQVEEITGYDFFSCLPDSIENSIESNMNLRLWNRNKRQK